MEKVIVVGAGPCGLSAAVELKKRDIEPLIIEKHAIVHSIYSYPTYLQFFSTPELLEIGGLPFSTPNEKPYRLEALQYYRNVAKHYKLNVQSYTEVTSIHPDGGHFRLHTSDRFGHVSEYEAERVVVSTGYFDTPNLLGIPGESLSKVSHYYREAHPYTGTKVVIIGGSNSAVDAAMDLMRAGADVTIVYRGEAFSSHIKPWVRPIFESMVNKGKIRVMLGSRVEVIEPDVVQVRTGDHVVTVENDFVLALTGFRPDRSLLTDAGVRLTGEWNVPEYDPATMETNVPGLYIAGVITTGKDANEIFIETGRFHGRSIAEHITARTG